MDAAQHQVAQLNDAQKTKLAQEITDSVGYMSKLLEPDDRASQERAVTGSMQAAPPAGTMPVGAGLGAGTMPVGAGLATGTMVAGGAPPLTQPAPQPDPGLGGLPTGFAPAAAPVAAQLGLGVTQPAPAAAPVAAQPGLGGAVPPAQQVPGQDASAQSIDDAVNKLLGRG